MPIVSGPPGAAVEVEVEEGNAATTFRVSITVPKGEGAKTSVTIPLAARTPTIQPPEVKILPLQRTRSRVVLGALTLFMALIGSSMLAVAVVAVLLFR